MSDYHTVVIDNGTGITKMGYAGNSEPEFVFPTAITELSKKGTLSVSTKNDELNYYIGDEAREVVKTQDKYSIYYPMQDGIISSWDLMEKFWHQSIYNYMKCDPQENYFILTEPPLNPPENRENIAEIFFETFNVPGIYIGIQATFSLIGTRKIFEDNNYANLTEEQKKSIQHLTGMVLDSGDGVTHIVPVMDGYVIGSQIKHIPIAGRKITKFIEQMLIDRGEIIKNEDSYFLSQKIKEKYGFISNDILNEFAEFDKKKQNNGHYIQSQKFKNFEGKGEISNKSYSIDLGYELFLGPEAFFTPYIIDKEFEYGVDVLIDQVIQKCPIDYKRQLYSNIILSGGSTSFKNFSSRLKNSVQDLVNNRFKRYATNEQTSYGTQVKIPQVHVTDNLSQKHVVWLGGSVVSSYSHFESKIVHTKREYDEFGPACCRKNAVSEN